MRMVCVSRLALSVWIAAALLAGCGAPRQAATLPPSTAYTQKSRAQSPSRADAPVHYVYVTDDTSASVSAFAINASTGTLTQVKGSPFAAGPDPWGVAVDPTGKFAYVTNVTDARKFAQATNVTSPSSSGSVSAYVINARSGALTQVKGSPFASGGTEPWEMTIGPFGKLAYVTNFYSDNVSVSHINPDEALGYGAIALFVDRATAVDTRFALSDTTAPIVAEICRRLDGIALAIELAAARVKVLAIPNLAQRLDERFRILTGGSRDALPRQKTLTALTTGATTCSLPKSRCCSAGWGSSPEASAWMRPARSAAAMTSMRSTS
ncbi:MAG: beta-propeller fold lactonase family protein [Candidatus Cybelea sp.]